MQSTRPSSEERTSDVTAACRSRHTRVKVVQAPPPSTQGTFVEGCNRCTALPIEVRGRAGDDGDCGEVVVESAAYVRVE